MINAQDIKIGTCIRMDGRLYFCIDFLHVKPGKGNTFMRTKLKDVVDGRVLERRFNIGEKLEDVRVEHRPLRFLWKQYGWAITVVTRYRRYKFRVLFPYKRKIYPYEKTALAQLEEYCPAQSAVKENS